MRKKAFLQEKQDLRKKKLSTKKQDLFWQKNLKNRIYAKNKISTLLIWETKRKENKTEHAIHSYDAGKGWFFKDNDNLT